MRHFNDREKIIISLIVNQNFHQTSSFSKILEEHLFNANRGSALLISYKILEYTLYVKNFENDNFRAEIIGEFFELYNLLVLLNNSNLIYVLPPSSLPEVTLVYKDLDITVTATKIILNEEGEFIIIQDHDYIWGCAGNYRYKGFHFYGKAFEQIQSLFLGSIYPSMDLIELVKSNWTSGEEKQFEEQLYIEELHHKEDMRLANEQLIKTKHSLLISHIALFLSFISIIISSILDTKISSDQFDILIETMKGKKETNTNDKQNQFITDSLYLVPSCFFSIKPDSFPKRGK